MQIFKADKNVFWVNELGSWLLTLASAALIYFGLQQFLLIPNDRLVIAVVVLLFIKIGDTLTQYHVTEIQVDSQEKQVIFILNSIVSGQKVKRYSLEQVRSELIRNSGITKVLSSSSTLKIFLVPKDMFRINNRYGFTTKILSSVDDTLKSLHNSVAT